jgi:UDP-N-acetylglucosamine acyltransferase
MNKPEPYVHSDAKIGDNVTIEPFAYIDKDVEIGDNSWIGPNACIWEGARIGKNCNIFSGAQVSCIPQDLKFNGEKTLTVIGENTTIREFVTISRGTNDRKQTFIGTNNLLMAYVHVAHDCVIGNQCVISNSVQVAGHVSIDDYVIIGGTAAVRQFVKIGSHAMIAGGSLVRKDVPPYVSAAREPLSYSGINAIGLRRRKFSTQQLNDIQEIYRTIYLSDINITKALDKIEAEFPASAEKDNIVAFIKNSERGIMKGVE